MLVLQFFSKVNGGLATAWGMIHSLLPCSLLYSWAIVTVFKLCHDVLRPFLYGTNFNLKHSEFTSGCWLSNHKKLWFLVFSSMYIDRCCATESLSSLVKQHIPAATLLQQSDQQLVYSLPFKDMDKFSGIPYFQFLDCWTRFLHWGWVFLIYLVYFSI